MSPKIITIISILLFSLIHNISNAQSSAFYKAESNITALELFNEQVIYIGTKSGKLIAIEQSSKKIVLEIEAHKSAINSIAITDGKAFTVSGDNFIKVWNINNGALLETLNIHTENIHSIYSRGGKLISIANDSTVKVIDTKNFQLIDKYDLRKKSNTLTAIYDTYFDNGKLYISCGYKSAYWGRRFGIYKIDINSGTLIDSNWVMGYEHPLTILSHNNSTVTGYEEGQLKIGKYKKSKLAFKGKVNNLFSFDSDKILVTTDQGINVYKVSFKKGGDIISLLNIGSKSGNFHLSDLIQNDLYVADESKVLHLVNLDKYTQRYYDNAHSSLASLKEQYNEQSMNVFINKFDSNDETQRVKELVVDAKNTIKTANIANKFEILEKKNTLDNYFSFIKEFENDPLANSFVSKAVSHSYSIAKANNKIDELVMVVDSFPDAPNTKQGITAIADIVLKENNIAGYSWFLQSYASSDEAKVVLQKLHQTAFELAEKVDTVDSYNDFIIAYPMAKQVSVAIKKSYDLEKKEYVGILNYFSEEKDARRLLVQSKLLEQSARGLSSEARQGYMMVVNRMNNLLKEEFNSTDAALRHLESNEFNRFISSFQQSMRDLQRQVTRIAENTSNLSSIMKKQSEIMNNHFVSAAQDREMASELTKQHRFWERYIGKVGY